LLKRIYVDNYRCFVNFTFKPKEKQLILGINGTGKSVFFEVLGKLRDFASTGYKADQLFSLETRTRWQTVPQQSFELEVTGNGGTYVYTLWVETQEEKPRTRVLKESLDFNEKPLILFHRDQVHLFDDIHAEKASIYPFDPDRSALAVVGPRKANSKLAWFKGWLDHLHCLRVNPSQMTSDERDIGRSEDYYLEDDLSNFPGWYSHNVQEQTGAALDLQKSLREVIQGFDSLHLTRVGRAVRELRAYFQKSPNDNGRPGKNRPLEFGFDELSEGQRVLIALYALLHFAVGPERTMCVDEPDNFLALSEIQPWLLALNDRVDDEGGQVILVSHHPEVLNLLAPEHGVLFSRTGLGPVQAVPYRPDTLGKLLPSEQIARGWERG
jgi:energy-coupling factor transporter ATP-binding protein EcfA2